MMKRISFASLRFFSRLFRFNLQQRRRESSTSSLGVFFSPTGERILSKDQLTAGVFFLIEGGQFIWPGIKIGHVTTVPDVQGFGSLEMTTLSLHPLIFAIEKFLRDDEIDTILELSLPHLASSGVSLKDADIGKPASTWRTSLTYFLKSEHPTTLTIDQRVADLMKIPISHQEDVQVLRYEKTQKYVAHYDAFNYKELDSNPSLQKTLQFGYRNRMATVFWYMSDVLDGGSTNFPMAGGLPYPNDVADCSNGINVYPKKGKVIVFYDLLATGDSDNNSLHAGCPVKEGTKFSGNKWVWNKPRR